jgi:hypothetical protein
MFGLNEIWFLLIIPFLATIWCLIWHHKAIKLWELALIWGVAITAIFISQIVVEKISVADWEVWGYSGVQAIYDEPFQYWDTCSETYECGKTCSGGKKRSCSTKYCTRTYACKEWAGDDAWLIDQRGKKRHISKARFRKLESQQWANTKTIDLKRHKHYDIIVDGDRRVTKWPGTWETAEPIAETHIYENRTVNSTTVRFMKVTDPEKEAYGLFDYPTFYGGYEVQTIMDQNGRYWKKADQKWRYLNGILGSKRKGRIWVLIFRDKDRSVFEYQKGYWHNGNKNEFIFCIGADKAGNIKWGDVISWTEVEELKIEFRDYISNKMKVVNTDTLIELAGLAEKELMTRYVKPEFTEKFKHLSIRPSMASMIITALIICVITGLICWWAVKNDFRDYT